MAKLKRKQWVQNALDIIDAHETQSRLAAGDVVSLRDLDNTPRDGRDLHEAVLERYERVRAAKLPGPQPSEEMLETEVTQIVKLLEDSWVTINFSAHHWFNNVDEVGSSVRNQWEGRGRGADSRWTGYDEDREATERAVGRYGASRDAYDGDDAFEQRVDAVRLRSDSYLTRESPLFSSASRPRYGTLDFAHCLHGGAHLYGRSFLVLREHVKHRATYTPGDSYHLHSLGRDMGEEATTFFDLEKLLLYCAPDVLVEMYEYAMRLRRLGSLHHRSGDYIEAQLHMQIQFERDVAQIHLSVTEDLMGWDRASIRRLRERLREFAYEYGIELYEI